MLTGEYLAMVLENGIRSRSSKVNHYSIHCIICLLIRFHCFTVNFTEMYSSIKPELTFNCDETMLAFDTNKQEMVITTRSSIARPPVAQPDDISTHITLLLCVSATGGHSSTSRIPPLVNLPYEFST